MRLPVHEGIKLAQPLSYPCRILALVRFFLYMCRKDEMVFYRFGLSSQIKAIKANLSFFALHLEDSIEKKRLNKTRQVEFSHQFYPELTFCYLNLFFFVDNFTTH